MSRKEKQTVREQLNHAKTKAAEKTEQRIVDREKVKVKERSVQR